MHTSDIRYSQHLQREDKEKKSHTSGTKVTILLVRSTHIRSRTENSQPVKHWPLQQQDQKLINSSGIEDQKRQSQACGRCWQLNL